MCTGLELLAGLGSAASGIGAVGGLLKGGDKGPAAPDPAKERAKAEAEATQKANAKISMQRKAMRENSLLTGAGMASTTPASAQAGRTTMGV